MNRVTWCAGGRRAAMLWIALIIAMVLTGCYPDDDVGVGIGGPEVAGEDMALPSTQPGPSFVMIINELHGHLIGEQLTIRIEAFEPAILQIDKTHPIDIETAALPRVGQYSYTLQSRSLFQIDGLQVELMGEGSGTLTANATNNRFRVSHDLRDDRSLVIGLVED